MGSRSTRRSTRSSSASMCVTTTTALPAFAPGLAVSPEIHIGTAVESLIGLVQQENHRIGQERQGQVQLLSCSPGEV